MSSYFLIESRDPYESGDTRHVAELAVNLKHGGHEVAVFLVNNGVITARRNSHHEHLDELLRNGVAVFADDFSLRERAIAEDALKPGIATGAIDIVIDRLTGGSKVIWH